MNAEELEEMKTRDAKRIKQEQTHTNDTQTASSGVGPTEPVTPSSDCLGPQRTESSGQISTRSEVGDREPQSVVPTRPKEQDPGQDA